MKLTIPERIALLNLLPTKGGFVTLSLVSDMREAIRITPTEIKKAAIQELPDGRLTMNNEAALSLKKEIPFDQTARAIIETAIKECDNKKQLTLDQLPLYRKFMLAEEPKKKVQKKKK